ncbi:MAG: hypothetical protein SCALA702_10580 [Melioribacteraceae bacterium]|nr:MAG: hypothetical protein SCALA702_10580 [Melioribacteraceae bacterium]
MKQGYLSNYFKGIAAKRLSAVEIDPETSHRHEFNSVAGLKTLFGISKKILQAKVLYFDTNEDEFLSSDCEMTWYDARENNPDRTEHRLYFRNTAALEKAGAGDLLVIALTNEGEINAFIAKTDSTIEKQLLWLFGISDLAEKFESKTIDDDEDSEISFAFRFIFDELGIEIKETADEYLEQMIREFGNSFPSTRKFSEFARKSLGDVDYSERPDNLIMQFFEREEMLFRTFENHIVREKLVSGFGGDVDKFISYSLSVQNRRKSRAGYALENQLENIFTNLEIKFSRGKETENKSKPDFLFPRN